MALTPEQLDILKKYNISPTPQQPVSPENKVDNFMSELDTKYNPTLADKLGQVLRGTRTGTNALAGGLFETAGNITNSDTLKGMAEAVRARNEEINSQAPIAIQNQLAREDGINATKLADGLGQAIPTVASFMLGGEALQGASKAAQILAPAATIGASMGGQTAMDVRQQFLDNPINQAKYTTPGELQAAADHAANMANIESGLANTATTALAGAIGGSVAARSAEKGLSPLKAAGVAAATDSPFNAGQGFVEEGIQSSNANREYDTNRAKEMAAQGLIVGSGISGGLAAHNTFKQRRIPLAREEDAQKSIEWMSKVEGKPIEAFETMKNDKGQFVVYEKIPGQEPVVETTEHGPLQDALSSVQEPVVPKVDETTQSIQEQPLSQPADTTNPVHLDTPTPAKTLMDGVDLPVEAAVGKSPIDITSNAIDVNPNDTITSKANSLRNLDPAKFDEIVKNHTDINDLKSKLDTELNTKIDDLHKEYHDKNLEAKAYKRSTVPLDQQIITREINKDTGEHLAVFGDTVHGIDNTFTETRKVFNPEKKKYEQAKVMLKDGLKTGDEVKLVRETLPTYKDDVRGDLSNHEVIHIEKDGKRIGTVSEEFAKTLAQETVNGNLDNVTAKFYLEPMPRSQTNKDTIWIGKSAYRPSITIGGRVKNINSMYSNHALNREAVTKSYTDVHSANKAAREEALNPKKLQSEPNDPVVRTESNEFAKANPDYKDTVLNLMSKFNGMKLVVHANEKVYISKNADSARVESQHGELKNQYGFYDPTDKTVYLNIDKIKSGLTDENSIYHGMNEKEAIEGTAIHEIMVHRGLDTKYPTKEALDAAMNDFYNKYPVIKELVKARQKITNEDVSLATEEVLANLGQDRVFATNNEGKVRLIRTDEYFKGKDSFLKNVLDTFKSVINDIAGKPIFDLSSTKNQVADIQKQLRHIGDEMVTNMKKAEAEFYEKATPDQVDTALKFMRDPTNAANDSSIWSRFADNLFAKYLNLKATNLHDLGNVVGRAQSDEKVNTIYKGIRDEKLKSNSFVTTFMKPINDLFQSNIVGWQKGPSKFDINGSFKFMKEGERQGKIFTSDELRQQGATENQIRLYRNQMDQLVAAKELELKSKIYKSLNVNKLDFNGHDIDGLLKSNREIGDISLAEMNKNVSEFIAKVKADIQSDATAKGEDPKVHLDLVNGIEKSIIKMNQEFEDNKHAIPIKPNGDFYYYIKDSNKGTSDIPKLETFKSVGEMRVAIKKLKLQPGQEIKEGLLSEHSSSSDNSLERSFEALKIRLKEEQTPYDMLQSITKHIDDVSAKAAENLYRKDLEEYHATLKDDVKLYKDMQKLMDYAFQSKDEGGFKGFLKATNTIMFLGGSIATSAFNFTAIPIALAPFASQYGGGKHIMGALKLAGLHLNKTGDALASSLAKSGYFKGHEAEAEAILKKLHNSGLLSEPDLGLMRNIYNDQLNPTFERNTKNAMINGIMLPFKYSEMLNRRTTILTALKVALEQKGTLKLDSHEKIVSFAADWVDQTQGNYSRENRPVWARNSVGELLYAFKTYPITQLQTAIKYGNPLKNKASAMMLGSMLALLGEQGMFFTDDLEDIFNTIGRALGFNANAKQWKEDFLEQHLGKGGKDLVMHGLLGLMGLDGVSSRMGMNNILPGTTLLDPSNKDVSKSLLEIAGPTGAVAKKLYTGANEVLNGEISKGLIDAMPNFVKSAADAYQASQSGYFTDSGGRKVMKADGLEIFGKALGFQPNKMAEMYRELSKVKEKQEILDYMKGRVTKQMVDAIHTNDAGKKADVQKFVSDWNKSNPELRFGVDYASVRKKLKDLAESPMKNAMDKTRKPLRQEVRKVYENLDKE